MIAFTIFYLLFTLVYDINVIMDYYKFNCNRYTNLYII